MIKRFKFLLFVILLTATEAFSQATKCETIYDTVETSPRYEKGMNGLMEYFGQKLTPIISDCSTQDKELITELTMVLTIDSGGKVIDVVFSNHRMTADCVTKLKGKLLTMTGWVAGRLNDQAVYCYYTWPISCIKWG